MRDGEAGFSCCIFEAACLQPSRNRSMAHLAGCGVSAGHSQPGDTCTGVTVEDLEVLFSKNVANETTTAYEIPVQYRIVVVNEGDSYGS